MESKLKLIRDQGWLVAVHNDYHLNGKFYTFWLFTKGNLCVKGEADTDELALSHVLGEIERLNDNWKYR